MVSVVIPTLNEARNLPYAIAIVVRSGQQLLLTDAAARFLSRVEVGEVSLAEAQRLLPAGKAPPAIIDPPVRFGRPTVAGVATERLWELFDAGEPLVEIADGYELQPELVRSAVAYEEQLRSLAASSRWPRRSSHTTTTGG